jgi:hypothetical protein
MLAVVFIIALLLLLSGIAIFITNIRSSSFNSGTANANLSLNAVGNFRYEPVAGNSVLCVIHNYIMLH